MVEERALDSRKVKASVMEKKYFHSLSNQKSTGRNQRNSLYMPLPSSKHKYRWHKRQLQLLGLPSHSKNPRGKRCKSLLQLMLHKFQHDSSSKCSTTLIMNMLLLHILSKNWMTLLNKNLLRKCPSLQSNQRRRNRTLQYMKCSLMSQQLLGKSPRDNLNMLSMKRSNIFPLCKRP